MSYSSGHRSIDETALPQNLRIQLGHALVEHIARAQDVRLLHIKGYSVDPGLYAGGRSSSDIDVLVHPSDLQQFIKALDSRGWRAVTGFKSGSIFQHAATLWHDSWGYIDVHRNFPGVGVPPLAFFEDLWRSRMSRMIAEVECTVPAPQHQVLLIVLHAGRDSHRGASDVGHLRDTLPAEDWERLQDDANRFKAVVALAAATGGLAEYREHPDHDVWAAVSGDGTRMELLWARARAAGSLPGCLRILAAALVPNRDHLRMSLQKEPRARDYTKEIFGRTKEIFSDIRTAMNRPRR